MTERNIAISLSVADDLAGDKMMTLVRPSIAIGMSIADSVANDAGSIAIAMRASAQHHQVWWLFECHKQLEERHTEVLFLDVNVGTKRHYSSNSFRCGDRRRQFNFRWHSDNYIKINALLGVVYRKHAQDTNIILLKTMNFHSFWVCCSPHVLLQNFPEQQCLSCERCYPLLFWSPGAVIKISYFHTLELFLSVQKK